MGIMKFKFVLPLLVVAVAVVTAFARISAPASTQVKLKAQDGGCEVFTITLAQNCSLMNGGDVCTYTVGAGDIREVHEVTTNCEWAYRKP